MVDFRTYKHTVKHVSQLNLAHYAQNRTNSIFLPQGTITVKLATRPITRGVASHPGIHKMHILVLSVSACACMCTCIWMLLIKYFFLIFVCSLMWLFLIFSMLNSVKCRDSCVRDRYKGGKCVGDTTSCDGETKTEAACVCNKNGYVHDVVQ